MFAFWIVQRGELKDTSKSVNEHVWLNGAEITQFFFFNLEPYKEVNNQRDKRAEIDDRSTVWCPVSNNKTSREERSSPKGRVIISESLLSSDTKDNGTEAGDQFSQGREPIFAGLTTPKKKSASVHDSEKILFVEKESLADIGMKLINLLIKPTKKDFIDECNNQSSCSIHSYNACSFKV